MDSRRSFLRKGSVAGLASLLGVPKSIELTHPSAGPLSFFQSKSQFAHVLAQREAQLVGLGLATKQMPGNSVPAKRESFRTYATLHSDVYAISVCEPVYNERYDGSHLEKEVRDFYA